MRSAQPRSAWPVVEPHNTVGKHDTFAEQAETRTAEHLALEHLDPPESQGRGEAGDDDGASVYPIGKKRGRELESPAGIRASRMSALRSLARGWDIAASGSERHAPDSTYKRHSVYGKTWDETHDSPSF